MGRPRTLRSLSDLEAAGLIPPERSAGLEPVTARYEVAITPHMAELIDPSNPTDPIARQFVPDERELDRRPAERDDPIGDDAKSPVKGVVHRHPDRVLLKVVSVCPVYCRFCFRREQVGSSAGVTLTEPELGAALAYIRSQPKVWEVILTGGDPWVLSPRRIADLSASLSAIGHVKVLRWHTRVPAVAPERVTPLLVRALKVQGATVYVALHANHPRELTPEAHAACARIIDAGIPMVSQTVLLKGVNDNAETLDELMRAFVGMRIKPYYLHHGDLAPGTAHFRTTIAEGKALMRALRARLSGLALPTYVLDIPGGAGKVPLADGYVTRTADGEGTWSVESPDGGRSSYEDCCAGPRTRD